MQIDLTSILIAVFVFSVLWGLLKLAFKITTKIFSCGCLTILALGALAYLLAS